MNAHPEHEKTDNFVEVLGLLEHNLRRPDLSRGSLAAYGEFGAGRSVGIHTLTRPGNEPVLIQQQVVEKHQFILHIRRKTLSFHAAFDQNQFFQVFLSFTIAPQPA